VRCLRMTKRSRKTYRFGEFEFTSKDSARRFFGEMRQNMGFGGPITNPGHILALSELLRGHVEYEEKVKCGVRQFLTAPAPDHNSTCFWIERKDGSTTDFGVGACVQSIGVLNRQSFRAIIRPQIYAFKDMRLAGCTDTFVSEYSGETFPISQAHVDHEIEFEEIVKRFATAEGIDLEAELLTVSCDARSEPKWRDESLAARFLEFHPKFRLRLVSKRENLSDLRRKSGEE
jgi:Protein of unknown function (DUF3223)